MYSSIIASIASFRVTLASVSSLRIVSVMVLTISALTVSSFMYSAMYEAKPNNIELYKLALIHKSASLVLEDGRAINNERLEFLGDAVIEAG